MMTYPAPITLSDATVPGVEPENVGQLVIKAPNPGTHDCVAVARIFDKFRRMSQCVLIDAANRDALIDWLVAQREGERKG